MAECKRIKSYIIKLPLLNKIIYYNFNFFMVYIFFPYRPDDKVDQVLVEHDAVVVFLPLVVLPENEVQVLAP